MHKQEPPSAIELVAKIRESAKFFSKTGPSDKHIADAVVGFVEKFDYWYIRVMKAAVPKYRDLIIKRINPFIRSFECEGLSPLLTAEKLVGDYNSRNFVTAGGWAIEALATRVSPTAQKSSTIGIDLERIDPATGDHHLYVLKSGLVTRNSDIVSALKRNSRQAEKLLLQGKRYSKVFAHWAVVAGKTVSTFDDGIYRPSSAEFWSQIVGAPPQESVELVLAIATEAGRLVTRDASNHAAALVTLISEYISKPGNPDLVDWDFIALRNMEEKKVWLADDQKRHSAALKKLISTGYSIEKAKKEKVIKEVKPKSKK